MEDIVRMEKCVEIFCQTHWLSQINCYRWLICSYGHRCCSRRGSCRCVISCPC